MFTKGRRIRVFVMANTSEFGARAYCCSHRRAPMLAAPPKEVAMIRITATAASVGSKFVVVFSAVIASCADFCAGARQGRDIEERYDTLDCRSAPDGLTRTEIARAPLPGTRH